MPRVTASVANHVTQDEPTPLRRSIVVSQEGQSTSDLVGWKLRPWHKSRPGGMAQPSQRVRPLLTSCATLILTAAVAMKL